MPDPLAPFRWLQGSGPTDDIFCVSFFRGLEPGEVLRRFGAGSEEAAGTWMGFGELSDKAVEFIDETDGGSGGGYVAAAPAGKWSAAVELWGWEATMHDVAAGLSEAGEVVAVSRHDYAEHAFVHAVGGTCVTGFNPRIPSLRHGSAPKRLNPLMREVGLDPQRDDASVDEPIAAAFALAASLTGVAFAPGFLEQPLLVGDVRERN